MSNTKECRRCLRILSMSDFHNNSRLPDGKQTWCKKCINEYKKERRAKRRTSKQQKEYTRIQENRRLEAQDKKRCSVCREVKSLSEFWRGATGTLVHGMCAECKQARDIRRRNTSHRCIERRANKAIYDAIQKGQIKRPKICPVCGESPKTRLVSRIQFHHTDGYEKDKVFFGIFLCARCHARVHLGEIEVDGKQWL